MSSRAKTTPTPVRLDEETLNRVRAICDRNPWVSMSDIYRFAMRIGLEALERGTNIRLRGVYEDGDLEGPETRDSDIDAETIIKEAMEDGPSKTSRMRRKKA